MLHDLDELDHVLLAIFGIFLTENLRPCPAGESPVNKSSPKNPRSFNSLNSPVRHLVEVLGERGQIGRPFLILLLGPDEHLGDFDLVEQLRIEQGHLFGNFGRFEIEQGGWRCHHRARRRRSLIGFPGKLLLVQ